MSGTTTSSRIDHVAGSLSYDTSVQHNAGVVDLDGLAALVAQLRTFALTRVFGNPGLAISTNFDVKNGTAVFFSVNGVMGTLAANTVADTGTAATFPATKFGAFVVSVATPASPALTATWATNASAGYASEALAIAALAAVALPASSAIVGYVTVQAHASNSFTAGTDALTTGTGGNVAAATTYYNDVDAGALLLGAAYTVTAAKVGNSNGTVVA